MRLHLLLCLAFSVALSATEAKSQVLWNIAPLDTLLAGGDEAMRQSCLRQGEEALSEVPVSVVYPPKPFVSDQHNYASLSPYFWPDSTDATKPYVNHDGLRNPEAERYDRPKLERLSNRLRTLSVALYLTREERFHNAITEQLTTWFTDSATYMYPRFDYAQIVPGRNDSKGNFWGIIEAYAFVDITEAIRLTEAVQPLDDTLQEGLRQWFAAFARWLREDPYGQKEAASKNNHGAAYDVLLLALSLYNDDPPTVRSLTDAFAEKRLSLIAADGSQPAELARTNALSYSIYNLSHILDFCFIQQSLGNDYYGAHRQEIDTAFAYLWQYAPNPAAFPYQEIKNWQSSVRYLREKTARLERLAEGPLPFVPPDMRPLITPTPRTLLQ